MSQEELRGGGLTPNNWHHLLPFELHGSEPIIKSHKRWHSVLYYKSHLHVVQ